MSHTLEEFLAGLNLGQYVENLRANGVDTISLINEEALETSGIDKVGHKKRILKELMNLNLIPVHGNDLELELKSPNNSEVIANPEVKETDSPPPLPPKSKTSAIIKPQPPARTISVKPIKPPRTIDSLPADFKLLTDGSENYMKMPPVPPRQDLGEVKIPPDFPAPPEELLSPFLQSPETISTPKTISMFPTENDQKPLTILPKSSPSENVAKSSLPRTSTMSSMSSEKLLTALPRTSTEPGKQPLNSAMTSPTVPETFPSPKSTYPIPAPRKPKSNVPGQPIHKTVNIIENTSEQQELEETNVSEDDVSDGDPSDDGDLDVPEEKSLTISMTKNNDTFQKLLRESAIDLSGSQKSENRKSRFLSKGKSGYLYKKGGQRGDKSIQKRYIEFNGVDLRYFKEKGGEPKQTIPVSRMTDVAIETSCKKPTFHLITPNRTFTFIEHQGNKDEMTTWVSVLMEAILRKSDDGSNIGGSMSEPDKEGWLSKQGHSIIQDFKHRYVAIKEDKLCYYHTFQDFEDDLPISSIDMSLVSLREDVARRRLNLMTHTQRTYVFEAESIESYNSWKKAIEAAIHIGLSDCKYLQMIQVNKSNTRCADCDTKNPVWASANLFVVVCDECIGCHRVLGQKISKARSILMDQKIWTDELIELFQIIGNANANQLWAYKLPSDDQIRPDASRAQREEFVKRKYGDKRYFGWSENYGQPKELGDALRRSVTTDNVMETLKLVVSGADIFYVPEDTEDVRTPYELAKDHGVYLQMELLAQYQGHFTEEERAEEFAAQQNVENSAGATSVEAEKYEKSGMLKMRLHEKENWREEKMYWLKGRRIEYRKSAKPEDVEYIDLTQIEELSLIPEDRESFSIRTSSRTYFFKASTPDDCDSWYQTIRNKQVFGVALEKQEVGPEKIPHLLHECFDYIEKNALTETKTLTQKGIYRLSGAHGTIKRLVLLFNQDAAKMRLDIEEYHDVHAVAGLLKQYLRDLPEPVLTNDLRSMFISNTDESIEHEERLYRYKDFVKSLPEINRLCLRRLVLHLNLVVQLSDFNLMTIDNIVLIFGPIIVSCATTLDQPTLNKEYAVLKDLLTYYQWIFDVTDTEMKSQQAIIDFIRSMNQTTPPAPSDPSMNSMQMQIPLFIESTEDQMKMDSTTRPYDVCMYATKKCELDFTTDWALFEVTNNNCFERPVSSKEKVLELALTLSTNGKLVVKENHIAEKLSRHQSASLGLQGYLHYSTKGEKWKKSYYIDIRHGNIRVSSKKDAKEEENIGIHEILLYVGVVEKKSPGKHGFRIKVKNSTHKDGEYRYFCSDNEYEVDMFIASILNIRYPAGLWTERVSKNLGVEESEERRFSQFWGRQSTVLAPQGASTRLVEQLLKKKGTLRRKKKE